MAVCEHYPVITHRTGGISADRKNVCGACGQIIWHHKGRYGYTDSWIRTEGDREPIICPKCKGFDDYCGDIQLCGMCGGKGYVVAEVPK